MTQVHTLYILRPSCNPYCVTSSPRFQLLSYKSVLDVIQAVHITQLWGNVSQLLHLSSLTREPAGHTPSSAADDLVRTCAACLEHLPCYRNHDCVSTRVFLILHVLLTAPPAVDEFRQVPHTWHSKMKSDCVF